MARSDPQVNFRIPAELKEAIEAAAALSNRTVTAEIVSRLQASFPQPSESGSWERSFPSAAASLRTNEITRQAAREQWLLQALHRTQLQAKHEALVSQVLSLESQAMALHHQVMQLDNEIERADTAGEPGKVSLALKQAKASRERLAEIDVRISATKRLIDACTVELAHKRLTEAGHDTELDKTI